MKNKPNLEMVKAACEWWGDVILDAKQDNGDVMQSGLKEIISSLSPPVTKEMRDIFVSNLYEIIIKDWNSLYRDYNPGYYEIDIDYGVDSTLQKASYGIGISNLKFPMKTCMHIGINFVKVSYGYGAPWKVIAGEEYEKI